MKKILVSAVVLFSVPASGLAGESYFLIVFASQRPVLKDPENAHSWAVFIRLCGEGCDYSKYQMEYFTVSWLPCTLQVRVFALFPETGENVELHKTIQWALDNRQVVSYWGPYQITGDLYATAYRGAATLNSGAVRYKAVDSLHDTSRVTNCIHAVSDLAEGRTRLRIGTPGWGNTASYYITLTMQQWIVEWTTYDWIIDCLDLRQYPMRQRDIDRGSPTIRPALRFFQNAAQFWP